MHIREGFEAGADEYVIKPFSMDVLRIRIQSLLQSREQLKKLYGKRFSPEVVGVSTTSADERFSQKLYEIIEKNISDQNLGIEMLCDQIGISRANLYRKIKAISELGGGLALSEGNEYECFGSGNFVGIQQSFLFL